MAIHFVADLHFNSDVGRHMLPTSLSDTSDPTRRICETWRARVAEDDTVWILGNVGNPVHLGYLPGIKHLVRSASDPQPWNCLATGRYASVCDARHLETPLGTFLLVADPAKASENDALVLHGRARGDWRRPGYTCVAVSALGWGPLSLEDLLHSPKASRLSQAA